MDFITEYMAYTDGIPSPEIFRLWTGIACLAGALERRVWAETSRGALYPNLFTLLVASPGIGKTQAISPAEDLWYSTKKFYVSPSNMTKAALIDTLKESDRKIIINGGAGLFEYHSLLVAASEFGVLVPAHDMEFLSVLNHIYDNPRVHRERRRHFNGGKEIEIIHPQLNILAGSQPGFLSSLLPEEAWSMGFTSRIIMIYAGSGPQVPLFGDHDPRLDKKRELVEHLTALAGLMGRMSWTPDAADTMVKWYKAGLPPVPDHSKLVHYNTRRGLHTIKLSIISALSRRAELVVEACDVERARDWLLEAELLMPDIFREMVQKSDTNVIQELHFFMWRQYMKTQKPIHESMIFDFLRSRVPSEKIPRLLDVTERANIIARVAGTEKLYVPRPKADFGVE